MLKYTIYQQGESVSPQSSVERLSVTFADESLKSEALTRFSFCSTSNGIEEEMQYPTTPPVTPNVPGNNFHFIKTYLSLNY